MARVRARAYKPNPPRDGKTRTTYVKVRVIPLVPMPKSVLLDKVRESAESGVVDPQIEVTYVEYDHKYLNKRSGYRRVTDPIEALKDFYAVVTNADTADVAKRHRAAKRRVTKKTRGK